MRREADTEADLLDRLFRQGRSGAGAAAEPGEGPDGHAQRSPPAPTDARSHDGAGPASGVSYLVPTIIKLWLLTQPCLLQFFNAQGRVLGFLEPLP